MPALRVARGGLVAIALAAPSAAALAAGADHQACEAAIRAAEQRYGIPTGLLTAIGKVESGVLDDAGQRRPWPWSVNAQGAGRIFASRDEAVGWVSALRASGVTSIDVGCLQVNLRHHPAAFATTEQAFDPAANADYAARFLSSLRSGGTALLDEGWLRAAGHYHSSTGALSLPYRRLVEQAYGMPVANGPVVLLRVVAAPSPTLAARPARVAVNRDEARRRLKAALLVAGVGRHASGADRLATLLGLGSHSVGPVMAGRR
ncbi:transglycosylase SLT domain-containing protein [Belnapia sp. T18]|uniref:Transglycosylase SLT domain-containing protein n=1 Tax=Belnapia arida TaxID=2804533 RepID=A0ABS1U5R0_9PROT|nr:transglycosylase SLT domain-containing protein [Belnapia arida]MBL6080042.1 transglycosylase SLT domain-containing protein [Belnapia arida]